MQWLCISGQVTRKHCRVVGSRMLTYSYTGCWLNTWGGNYVSLYARHAARQHVMRELKSPPCFWPTSEFWTIESSPRVCFTLFVVGSRQDKSNCQQLQTGPDQLIYPSQPAFAVDTISKRNVVMGRGYRSLQTIVYLLSEWLRLCNQSLPAWGWLVCWYLCFVGVYCLKLLLLDFCFFPDNGCLVCWCDGWYHTNGMVWLVCAEAYTRNRGLALGSGWSVVRGTPGWQQQWERQPGSIKQQKNKTKTKKLSEHRFDNTNKGGKLTIRIRKRPATINQTISTTIEAEKQQLQWEETPQLWKQNNEKDKIENICSNRRSGC